MKILVTGAAGFIGSHLAEELSVRGHLVVGLDCMTDFYSLSLKKANVKALAARGIDVHCLDLASDDIAPAMDGVETVFHLAAQPSISPDVPLADYLRNNVLATHNLLRAAKDLPWLTAFVYVSSSSVYGAYASGPETSEPKPVSAYGITKLTAEQLVLAHTRMNGFPGCSARLFSVYGPRERPDKLYFQLIRCSLENRPFNLFHGSGEHVRSFTYVDDAVRGLTLILDSIESCRGEIFNVGSDRAVSTAEGIRMIEDITGKAIPLKETPGRQGDQVRTKADIEKARRVLGYEPSVDLYEGLTREVEWFRSALRPSD